MNEPNEHGWGDDDRLDEAIATMAREMTDGEPLADLPVRVREQIGAGLWSSRRWAWQLGAAAALLLLAVAAALVLRAPDRVSEHVTETAARADDRAYPEIAYPEEIGGPEEDPADTEEPAYPVVERVFTRAGREAAAKRHQSPSPADSATGDLSPLAEFPALEIDPIVVSIEPPRVLPAPSVIVFTDIAVQDLAVRPLEPWKESR